jgi:hypothetical protein
MSPEVEPLYDERTVTVEPLTDETNSGPLKAETGAGKIVMYDPTMAIGPRSQVPLIVVTEPFPEQVSPPREAPTTPGLPESISPPPNRCFTAFAKVETEAVPENSIRTNVRVVVPPRPKFFHWTTKLEPLGATEM